MKEEIEQLLDDNKFWEREDINISMRGREDLHFNPQLVAIELEKYVAHKVMTELQILVEEFEDTSYSGYDVRESIKNGINWYKETYNL